MRRAGLRYEPPDFVTFGRGGGFLSLSALLPIIGNVRVSGGSRTNDGGRGSEEKDFIDRLTTAVERTRPYSWESLGIALVAVAAATILRAAFGWAGGHFALTFYIPAILVAGLVSGIPAAVGAAVSSVLIVWWAFVPPYFQFEGPEVADVTLVLLFATVSSATILLAYWCRSALIRLRDHQTAYRMIAQELQHRNKNAMAVVEAVVTKSLADDRERARIILGRLRAVARAEALLLDPAAPQISFETLLAGEFAAYGMGQLIARGPEIDMPGSYARHLLLGSYSAALTAITLITFTSQSPGADGNSGRGQRIFQACAPCHSLEPDRNMAGPSLAGLWHRKAGMLPSFDRYSSALKASQIEWADRTLDEWISDPQHLVPGNQMTFRGIKDAQQRKDLIAFLKQASQPGAQVAQGGGGVGGMMGGMGGMMGGGQIPSLKKLDAEDRVDHILQGHLQRCHCGRKDSQVLGTKPAAQD